METVISTMSLINYSTKFNLASTILFFYAMQLKKRSKLKSWFDVELRKLHKTKRSAYYQYLQKKTKKLKQSTIE